MEIINYLDSQFNDESSRTVTELDKVVALPKSTYYESKSRKPSNQQKRKETFLYEIEKLFYANREIYGAPMIHNKLVRKFKESSITLRTTSVYMAELGLRAITTPKYNAPKNHPQKLTYSIPMLNYLKDERPIGPGTHLVTDITYIYATEDEWVYLLSYMDLFTRKIISWDVSDTMTAEWVTKYARISINMCPNCIYIHSDRGVQYTSKIYLEALLTNGVCPSFSAKEYPYHNAWIESFHAQLKKEWIYRRVLRTKEECKKSCFKYIEGFYNTVRPQKHLDTQVQLNFISIF